MRVCFAIPGDLAILSGGYGYDRALLRDLPSCGIVVDYLRLADGFPFPRAADIDSLTQQLRDVTADALLVDGLAFGALPASTLEAIRLPMVALVHHPLGLEAGLSPAQSRALLASERQALGFARHVIVTSDFTKQTLLKDFGVTDDRVTVAPPGTQHAVRASGSTGPGLCVLAVGAVIARKAYDLLVAALAETADVPWTLTIVGSLNRDPQLVDDLRRQISGRGLSGRISLVGELDDASLASAYERADLFALSSLYEGYGMVLGEAMAHGIAIVTSTGGAAGETVPDSAALKCAPGDHVALAQALRHVMQDGGLRRRLAEAAHEHGRSLPTWMETARVVAEVLRHAAGAIG